MTTNYVENKTDAASALLASSLPIDISQEIFKSLSKNVSVAEFDSVPTGAELNGKDLALINIGGTVDLSGVSAADIRDVDAFIFTTNDGVTFILDGAGTGFFKGVVATNGGNDSIVLNSTLGVTVSSGDGNDSVTTGSGNDSVSAGSGNDSIVTGAGNDSVSTGSGTDSVSTGDGNDIVLVGSGSGGGLLNGDVGNSDSLDLRLVTINNVDVAINGEITITFDGGFVITASNFEQFIYDSNGTTTAGGIVTVGVNDFDAAF